MKDHIKTIHQQANSITGLYQSILGIVVLLIGVFAHDEMIKNIGIGIMSGGGLAIAIPGKIQSK